MARKCLPRLFHLIEIYCLILGMFHSQASADTIVILTSRTGGGYEEVIKSLQIEIKRMPSPKVNISIVQASESTDLLKLPEDTIGVVTIGLLAASQILVANSGRIPILSLLLPRISYELLTKNTQNRQVSAIFVDQPLQRQLDLIRTVMPSARKIGVIYGPQSEIFFSNIKNLASIRGFSVQSEFVSRDSELYIALQSILIDTDVFLALPDPLIINVSTAQNVLLTSFRFRVPVIGHSAAYTHAGALAAVYSTPNQIGIESGQILRQFIKSGLLPNPSYPRLFSVSINQKMAENLGLVVRAESDVVRQLQQLEKSE